MYCPLCTYLIKHYARTLKMPANSSVATFRLEPMIYFRTSTNPEDLESDYSFTIDSEERTFTALLYFFFAFTIAGIIFRFQIGVHFEVSITPENDIPIPVPPPTLSARPSPTFADPFASNRPSPLYSPRRLSPLSESAPSH